MKRIPISLLSAGLFSLWATTASAIPKEPDYPCFMIDAANRIINLADICPKSAPLPAVTSAAAPAVAKKPEAMSQKDRNRWAAYYSNRYCEGRKRGMTDEQAGDFAQDKMVNLLMTVKGIEAADSLDSAFYGKALPMRNSQCSQFSKDG